MTTIKLIKNSSIYTFVSILQKAILFFLLPVYTAYLTPEDFGILNVILSVSSFISVFILFSLQAAATRFHHQSLGNEFFIKKIWGTVTLMVLINSIIVGTLIIVLHKYLLNPLLEDIDFYPLVFFSILYTMVSPLYLLYQSYLQTKEDGVNYGINMTLNFLLNIGLILYFVIVLRKGVYGIILANLITAVIFFLYVFIRFIPQIYLKINRDIFKRSVKYSFPLVPHSLSAWFTVMMDRILVNNLVGKVETGIYSAGYQFGNIMNIITSSVNQAYVPWFYQNEKKGAEGQNKIQNIATLLTVVYCFLGFMISIFSKEILSIMVTNEYFDAWKVVPIITFAYIFNGIYFFYVNVLMLNNTNLVPLITFSSAIISVCLNIFLIPLYKEFGAAVSCITSIFIASIISAVLASRKNRCIKFNWKKIYLIIFVFFSLSLFVYIDISLNFWAFFLLKILFASLLMFLILFMYFKQIKFIFTSYLKK